MAGSGVVTFTDAASIALITASLVSGKSDPRWYVRHGWIVGAAGLYLGRVLEDYLLQRAAVALADGNGGQLPAGYEMFQPYLPPSYTGVQKPAAVPAKPALPQPTTPTVVT